MTRRLAIALALLTLTALAPVVATSNASPDHQTAVAARGAIPSNFRRHQEQYWVWYAPKDWIAASGKYDLNISSPTGTLWSKNGVSGVPCTSPAAWFKSLRENYRDTAKNGPGLYSRPLKGAHFTRIGKVQQLSQTYWRQSVDWAGKRKSGQKIKGQMIMDFAVVDQYTPACGESFLTRGAPAKKFGASNKLLITVEKTITQRNQGS